MNQRVDGAKSSPTVKAAIAAKPTVIKRAGTTGRMIEPGGKDRSPKVVTSNPANGQLLQKGFQHWLGLVNTARYG